MKTSPTIINIAVIGGAKAGKTAVVERILGRMFHGNYVPTVHEWYTHEVDSSDGNTIQLNITDLPGTYSFPSMLKLAVETADVVLAVFTLNDEQSLQDVKWLCSEYVANGNITTIKPIIIVGTKRDLLAGESTYSDYSEVTKNAQAYVETSAKNDFGCKELLRQICAAVNVTLPMSSRKKSSRRSFKKLFKSRVN